MKRKLNISRQFKTDAKKLTKSEKEDTRAVVLKLQNDEPLEAKYHDHDLQGNYDGYRECHIRPDLLLVYKKTSDGKIQILYLARISSHTNIFDIKKSKKK